MSALRVFGITTIGLFALIGVMGVIKKKKMNKDSIAATMTQQESSMSSSAIEESLVYPVVLEKQVYKQPETEVVTSKMIEVVEDLGVPFVDRMNRLFITGKGKLPFVETVTYKARVPWMQGRPAWVTDYASYYNTSRHFIARSLNGSRDYYTQKVSSGDSFNVFEKGKDLRFYLVVDLSKLNMHVYAYDADLNIRYFLKSYRVGCGKLDKTAASGCLTTLGSYTLGDKIAIYKPGVEGFFKDQKIEMIQVFGTRWMPYTGEQDETAAMIRGYGIHGVPWILDETTGALVEDKAAIGCYNSSGCVRLLQEDIEELFSVVITKPTTVQIVKNLQEAKLPGLEWVDDVAISTIEGKKS